MRLKELFREEELKWALRAKVRKIVQGEDNTQFFHMIANGKHRKKRIFQLEQDERDDSWSRKSESLHYQLL